MIPRIAVLTLFLTALLAALPSTAQEVSESDDRRPVLLRGSRIFTPPIRNPGLTPEARIRATINTEGRVTEVETLSMEPSTVYDPDFREALEKQLSTWRYAPALENGQPVAAQLEWTVQFNSQTSTVRISSGSMLQPFDLPYQLEQRRTSEIGRADLDERHRILNGMVTEAEKRLDSATRRRGETDRFLVASDAEDPETLRIFASNLENTFRILDQVLGVEPRPLFFKNRVYVYKDRASLFNLPFGRKELGYYRAPGFFVFHLQAGSSDELLSHILRVAVHGYVDIHLVRAGLALPPWAEEGLADYFSSSKIKEGQLVPGNIVKARLEFDHHRGTLKTKDSEAGWDIKTLKRSRKDGTGFSISQVLEAGHVEFASDNQYLFYATAWAMIHFLRHGEDSWAVREFPNFMLHLAEGTPAVDAIEAVYGPSLEALNEQFDAYVKNEL